MEKLTPEIWEAIRVMDESAQKIIGCDWKTYMQDYAPHLHKFLQAQKKRFDLARNPGKMNCGNKPTPVDTQKAVLREAVDNVINVNFIKIEE